MGASLLLALMLALISAAPTNAFYRVENDHGDKARSKPRNNEIERVIRRLNRGDTAVVPRAFEMRRSLDGGGLEDLFIVLGCVATRYPRVFLEEAARQSLSPFELKQIVVALPLDTVDNIARMLDLLRSRAKSLESVTDPPLMVVRDGALAALRAQVERLE